MYSASLSYELLTLNTLKLGVILAHSFTGSGDWLTDLTLVLVTRLLPLQLFKNRLEMDNLPIIC